MMKKKGVVGRIKKIGGKGAKPEREKGTRNKHFCNTCKLTVTQGGNARGRKRFDLKRKK